MKTKSNNKDVYTSNGYKDREDYLNSLADDRGIDETTVNMLADMLGDSEDFDGLINALDDFEDFYEG